MLEKHIKRVNKPVISRCCTETQSTSTTLSSVNTNTGECPLTQYTWYWLEIRTEMCSRLPTGQCPDKPCIKDLILYVNQ